MQKSDVKATPVESKSEADKFGARDLKTNAAQYAEHKRIIDATSRYDNLDDAIANLKRVWSLLESQIENGGEYTPRADLGFGSDSAAVIAEKLTGRSNGVSATRKAFASMGK